MLVKDEYSIHLPPRVIPDGGELADSTLLTGEQGIIEERGLLSLPNSAVLAVPTGFGKTYLARRSVHNSLKDDFRAIYLCPLRALSRELYASWQPEYGPLLGVYTGETGTDELADMPSPHEARVMIFTPEKFDSYLRQWQRNLDWLAQVDLLVVDEIHTMGEGQRGATLEGIIARYRIINPYLRILGLSATLGNPEEIAAWLKASLYQSNSRPVPLEWRIATFEAKRTGAKGKELIAAQEALVTKQEGGQSIIFVQSRPRSEGLAKSLSEAGIRAEAHHAGLPLKKRKDIEAQYRAGEVDVLCATGTLGVGMNLPARKIVLHDLQRFENGGWNDLSVNEVWQLGGRAGRRGLDDRGEVVLISPKHTQVAARRFIEGKFEPINSALVQIRRLGEQVLVLIGSRMCRTLPQLTRSLQSYFIAHQRPQLVAAELQPVIERMCRAGMLMEDGEFYSATRLGYLAVRYQLSPETLIGWKAFVEFSAEMPDSVSMMDVLVLASGSCDFNCRVRVEVDDLGRLAESINVEPMLLKTVPVAEWAPRFVQANGKGLISAIKTALSLRAWTRLGDMDEVELSGFGQAHEVEDARKEMVRMLQAFHALLTILEEDGQPVLAGEEIELTERVRALTSMVATGLNEENASLSLVDGVGPVMARRLVAAGLDDIEILAQASVDEVLAAGGISPARAQKWIDEAGDLMAAGGAYRYKETQLHDQKVIVAGFGLDYYRWVRAATLDVDIAPEGLVMVSGGNAPHCIERRGDQWHCDCMDALKGNLCKHKIALLAHLNDPAIPAFDRDFTLQSGAQISLHQIWNSYEASGWK